MSTSGQVVAAFKPGGYQETDMDEAQRVLFCFAPNDPIRRFFVWLGKSKEFDALCLAAIICSCFFLMIEPPYQDIVKYPGQDEPNSTLVSFRTMKLCNLIFTIFFTAELTSRIMAQGLLMTKHAYLKDGWNVLDAVQHLHAKIIIKYARIATRTHKHTKYSIILHLRIYSGLHLSYFDCLHAIHIVCDENDRRSRY